MSGAPTTLFALRPILAARLREVLPAQVPVLYAVSLEALVFGQQVAPAVYLIYQGGAVPEVRPDGLVCRIRQTWLAVAVSRHLGDSQSGVPAQDDAGHLAGLALGALMGFRPAGASGPVLPAALPYGGDNPEATVQLVPVAFTVDFPFRAAGA